jgi:2-polyprenyl-3-methyl-5-hydroxy-6-metoxy-1,4-benzoquinol methylase
MLYNVDFKVHDNDRLQRMLNELYGYNDDITIKITHRNRLNRIFLLIKKLINKGVIANFDSAIDIGCNSGMYSKILSDFGFEYVFGIDISDECIRKANKTFSFRSSSQVLEYKNVSAEKIPLEKKFDFILCTEVLEHAKKPRKVIENIESILKPNGILIISLPNIISIPYLMTYLITYKIKRKKMDRYFRQHASYPFFRSLRLFNKEKFEKVRVSGINFSLCYPLLKRSYKIPMFEYINRADFIISALFPFKYFGQSICIVLKKVS